MGEYPLSSVNAKWDLKSEFAQQLLLLQQKFKKKVTSNPTKHPMFSQL